MKKQPKAIMRLISLITLLIFISNINTVAVQAATIASDSQASMKAEDQTSKLRQPIYVMRTTFFRDYGDAPFSLGAMAKGQLSYQSSDANVATVSDDGIVTIVGGGTAKITIQAAETELYASAVKTVTVIVNKVYQRISIPKSSYKKHFCYGDKPFYLKAKAKTPLSYKTSNPKIATVNSKGLVTIKGVGSVDITITAAETNKYDGDVSTLSIPFGLKSPKLKVKRVGKSTVKLSWTKVPGASGYRVSARIYSEKDRNPDGTWNYKTTWKKKSAKKRSALHRNLKRGKDYFYGVQAYRKVGKKTVRSYADEKVIRNWPKGIDK